MDLLLIGFLLWGVLVTQLIIIAYEIDTAPRRAAQRLREAERKSSELEKSAGLVFVDGVLQPDYTYPPAPQAKPIIKHPPRTKRIIKYPPRSSKLRARILLFQRNYEDTHNKMVMGRGPEADPEFPERQDPQAFGKATLINPGETVINPTNVQKDRRAWAARAERLAKQRGDYDYNE